MADIIGDEDCSNRYSMGGDHHVQLSDRLARSLKLITNIRVKISALLVPAQETYRVEKEWDINFQSVRRGQISQAVNEFGADHSRNTH